MFVVKQSYIDSCPWASTCCLDADRCSVSDRISLHSAFLLFFWRRMLTDTKSCAWSCLDLNGVFKSLLLKVIHFSLVQDMEQFYELWLKSQKNEKSDDVASQPYKENGKQIHMPTDYAEVTVSTGGGSASPLLPSLRWSLSLSPPPSPEPGSITRHSLPSSSIFIFSRQGPLLLA